MNKIIFMIVALTLVAPSFLYAETPEEVEVKITTEYVDVYGDTLKELDKHLRQYGPLAANTNQKLRHAYGSCAWNVSYNYDHVEDEKGYSSPGSIKVTVYATYHLPKWEAPDRVPQDVKNRWTAYAESVRVHEEGHKDIAVKAGHKLLDALKALPSYRTSSDLNQAVRFARDEIITQACIEQDSYDENSKKAR